MKQNEAQRWCFDVALRDKGYAVYFSIGKGRICVSPDLMCWFVFPEEEIAFNLSRMEKMTMKRELRRTAKDKRCRIRGHVDAEDGARLIRLESEDGSFTLLADRKHMQYFPRAEFYAYRRSDRILAYEKGELVGVITPVEHPGQVNTKGEEDK